MKIIKLISMLAGSIIYPKAELISVFSHDTYNIDLVYKNKNYGPKITFLKQKQLDKFAQLFLVNSKNLYLGDNPENFINYLIRNKDQKIWGCNFKNNLNIMTCTIEKNLAGFVCFLEQTNNCENYHVNVQTEISKVGYIALLCVNRNYRQQKIGTLLISSALDELFLRKKATYVTILTTLDNKPAQNLFVKMGFKKIHEDKIKNTISYKFENFIK